MEAIKRPNRLFKGHKKDNSCLWYCCSFVTKKHLKYMNIFKYFPRNLVEVLLGLVLELITDASPTCHGLCDCTLWVQ